MNRLNAEQLKARGGPYSPAEFLTMNPPPPAEPKILPDEVTEAATAVDVAIGEYDAVRDVVFDAKRAMDSARNWDERNAAAQRHRTLQPALENADTRLREARAKYNRLMIAHSEKVRLDEYAATLRDQREKADSRAAAALARALGELHPPADRVRRSWQTKG